MRRGCFLARQRAHKGTWLSDSIPSFHVSMYLRTCYCAATPRRHLQPPTRTAPTPASSISRRARKSTRDTLPWAACTFHTLGNKVLHKTRCAKDRGRSKDTFGNRFEVYWYDAGDGVLHEDDWHFKLMRWQLIALYVIIGDGSLSLRTPWCH
jgi:hypothetical protein